MSKRKNKDQELMKAALTGDTTATRELLNSGADACVRHKEHSEPLLILAARLSKPQIIQALLDNGADVNATDDRGRTALMSATFRGDREPSTVRNNIHTLLQAGADVNKRDNEGRTALMWSVGTSLTDFPDPQVAELLLANGADINIQDNEGKTALMWAVECHPDPLVIKTLLDNNANVNAQDTYGRTALAMLTEDSISMASLFKGHK